MPRHRLYCWCKDDGEGIPRDAIARLTERFYRVDVKRSRENGGTGLGLAIVKHIVNRHQGRLQIDSKAGRGQHLYGVSARRLATSPQISRPMRPVTEVL